MTMWPGQSEAGRAGRRERLDAREAEVQRAPIPDRAEVRARYHAYQRAAQQAVEANRFPESPAGLRVKVEDHPGVQMVEDGAFVEARIWVPRSVVEPMVANVTVRTGTPGEEITR